MMIERAARDVGGLDDRFRRRFGIPLGGEFGPGDGDEFAGAALAASLEYGFGAKLCAAKMGSAGWELWPWGLAARGATFGGGEPGVC